MPEDQLSTLWFLDKKEAYPSRVSRCHHEMAVITLARGSNPEGFRSRAAYVFGHWSKLVPQQRISPQSNQEPPPAVRYTRRRPIIGRHAAASLVTRPLRVSIPASQVLARVYASQAESLGLEQATCTAPPEPTLSIEQGQGHARRHRHVISTDA